MIELEGVWKHYPGAAGTTALRGVTLRVGAGEGLVLTGPSGAGKSTLLRLIFAAEHLDRGELRVAGRSLARLSSSSIPFVRRNIGVVFQDFKLLSDRSALENVAIALEILHLPRREVDRRARAALEAVGLLARADERVVRLSGGEQQRVAVARAIVGEPAILLADEPTGNLDPERSSELLALLQQLQQRGTTLIVATHDPLVVQFGRECGWRSARLEAGDLLDLHQPVVMPGRPARLDEPTDGFVDRRDADATRTHRAQGLLRMVK